MNNPKINLVAFDLTSRTQLDDHSSLLDDSADESLYTFGLKRMRFSDFRYEKKCSFLILLPTSFTFP